MLPYTVRVLVKKLWHKRFTQGMASPHFQATLKGPSPLMNHGWIVQTDKGLIQHARSVVTTKCAPCWSSSVTLFCSRDCCLCTNHQLVKELRHAGSKGNKYRENNTETKTKHKPKNHKNQTNRNHTTSLWSGDPSRPLHRLVGK